MMDKATLAGELRASKLRIEALPQLMADLREQVYSAKTAAVPLQNAVKDREAEVAMLVEAAVDVTSKKLYGNDAARKAETKRQLQIDGGYKDIVGTLARLEAAKTQLDSQLTALEHEFRAKESFINATCAEVRLLVAGQ